MNNISNKVVLLTNMPTPYRTPLFECLSKKVDDLVVVYCVEKESNRKWNVDLDSDSVNYIQMKTKTIKYKNKYVHYSFDLLKIYRTYKDATFIIGDASYNSYFLAAILKLLGKNYILWTGWTPTSFQQSKIGSYLKKQLLRHASVVLSYGTYTTKLISEYTSKKIINLYNSVDNSFYLKLKEEIKNKNMTNVRNIVYTGQLIERKNIKVLIEAVSLLDNINLILIGDGDQEYINDLIELSKERLVNVTFEGNKKPKEIYEIYSRCECLILPSLDEPWGLVINEALLFGLPVIVSHNVGCHHDLVVDGFNGYVVDPNKLEIKEAITKVFESRFNRNDIINKITNKSSIEISADGFFEAISLVARNE
ncbi:TPA: glycosyltransferase family 4 protein [Vibrio parahaemolyticus]|uniref:glycosyltransferase family 4 protein n=1 Tax=Vibrio parahaemolyticus TaxID=670 RepID=UPI0009AB64B1|nr:glycosyltransferase family 4 protein [Vibrio parahaemolyticus]EID7760875.1 glycosyltransferase family 4 protein [Vibrio parahaemolyticus]HCG6518415.1 glycosyltransferase family 4 protein [Vibrio parahaemolyticus]HCH0196985.1 glycosyltransferase family 4 protein [Vibrio parahaemolyticus]